MAGTEVFIYKPDSDELIDLTADVGPGFGQFNNKYSWTGFLYDGDGDGTDEVYIGTWNVTLDVPGIISTIVRGGGVLEAASVDLRVLNLNLEELRTEFPAFIQSDGGQIWRYDFADEEWTNVLSADHPNIDDGDPGIRKITEFDGKMIAATGRPLNMSENVAKMFMSEDGETWTQLTGGALDPAEGNGSIRTLEVVKNAADEDVLVLGTTNAEGAQVWAYKADGTWTKLATLESLVHSETFVDDNGDIYIGTWTPYKLYKLDIDAPLSSNLVDVTPEPMIPAPDVIDDDSIMQIIKFGDYYYVGSGNYSGNSVYRTMDMDDPDSWEVITTDGFETDGNGNELLDDEMNAKGVREVDYTWQMVVVDDVLYIGDYNGRNGLLLKSENGTDWEIVDKNFGDVDYGLRTVIGVGLNEDGLPDDTVEDNALIIGTATPYDDFEIDEIVPSNIISGTLFNDFFLNGTDEEDLIIGLSGNDVINAGSEDDIVFADLLSEFNLELGAGHDRVDGGSGDDVIIADSGNDTAWGGEGQDVIAGGNGRDLIYGGAGIDLLMGDEFLNDQVLGSLRLIGLDIEAIEGNGVANAQPLADTVTDTLDVATSLGNGILDSILSEEMVNSLNSVFGSYDDKIYGEAGSDVLIGGLGQDSLYGGSGKDVAYGGMGQDRIYGGSDDDYLFGEDGWDDIRGQSGNDVVLGGDGGDRIFGNSGEDVLFGEAGNDNIRGGTGDDKINGGLGNDLIRGDQGADIFMIGEVSGDDTIFDFQNGVDQFDISALGVDAGGFAAALDDAKSGYLFFSTRIDLADLGGDGSLILLGVNQSQIDTTDFIIA